MLIIQVPRHAIRGRVPRRVIRVEGFINIRLLFPSVDCIKRKNAHPVGWTLLNVGISLFSRAVTSQVFSAPLSLTSVFGMGTGGPSASSTPTCFLQHWYYTTAFIICQHFFYIFLIFEAAAALIAVAHIPKMNITEIIKAVSLLIVWDFIANSSFIFRHQL